MTQKLKLLIVEDEESIRNGLVDTFVYHGYEVDSAQDGEEALSKFQDEQYDLILLDIMLPKKDGFTVCEEIREEDRDQPIIMLTAKDSEEDIILGLRLGADDYIPKPFSIQELVLRVQAVLRRARAELRPGSRLTIGEHLVIDLDNLKSVSKSDDEGHPVVDFTRREIDILLHLQKNKHRPVSRGELLVQVWGYKKASKIETRTVDIHIAKLRRKIEPDHADPRYLTTVRGQGYKLEAELV